MWVQILIREKYIIAWNEMNVLFALFNNITNDSINSIFCNIKYNIIMMTIICKYVPQMSSPSSAVVAMAVVDFLLDTI